MADYNKVALLVVSLILVLAIVPGVLLNVNYDGDDLVKIGKVSPLNDKKKLDSELNKSAWFLHLLVLIVLLTITFVALGYVSIMDDLLPLFTLNFEGVKNKGNLILWFVIVVLGAIHYLGWFVNDAEKFECEADSTTTDCDNKNVLEFYLPLVLVVGFFGVSIVKELM